MTRHETILAEEFERANLGLSAAPHIEAIRQGKASEGIQAALRSMERAVDEERERAKSALAEQIAARDAARAQQREDEIRRNQISQAAHFGK